MERPSPYQEIESIIETECKSILDGAFFSISVFNNFNEEAMKIITNSDSNISRIELVIRGINFNKQKLQDAFNKLDKVIDEKLWRFWDFEKLNIYEIERIKSIVKCKKHELTKYHNGYSNLNEMCKLFFPQIRM